MSIMDRARYNATAPTIPDGNSTSLQTDSNGNLKVVNAAGAVGAAGYPSGSTPLTNSSGNKANTNAVATLTGTATTTVYITGFEITASGATAALVVTVTVAGVSGGTMSYTFIFPAGATAQATPLLVEFPQPIPASAINTPIVVTLPASGAGGTNATVVAHGYYI